MSPKTPTQSQKAPHEEDVWIPTLCYVCLRGPCLIRVQRVNGVVVNLEGNLEGPSFHDFYRNQGRICPKSLGQIQKLYNPYRIKKPLRRTNPEKGPGIDPKWVEISWDEALDTIAEKLKKIRAKDSRQLSVGGPTLRTTAWGTWPQFVDAFGATGYLGGGSQAHCNYSHHIFGPMIHGAFTCDPDVPYCNYLLVIGENPMATDATPSNVLYADARARGMKMVVVDPVLSVSAVKADEWIPIKPGTDTAFLLALIHVIIHEFKTYDEEFLKSMTNSPYLVGPDGYFVREKSQNKILIWDSMESKAKPYDDPTIRDFALEGTFTVYGVEAKPSFQVLKDHVRQYSPEWAQDITEIKASTIRRIAKEWVEHANIGSTIQIEGVRLPYRPVATRTGRGITGVMRGYQSCLADHILSMLVGALETVGSHKGGNLRPQEGQTGYGLAAPKDGMFQGGFAEHLGRLGPDEEYLIPFATTSTLHLQYLNIIEPIKNFPFRSPPEAFISYRSNQVLSLGDPKVVIGALKKIPFIVCIAYVHTEVTELSDIVLPEHNDLERFEFVVYSGLSGKGGGRASGKRIAGMILRQPAVEPLYDTMEISDILTELAERAGFLTEYNETINKTRGLAGPYKLDTNKKYAWVEIVDRECKSATSGEHDLSWFKEHGNIVKHVGVELQYGPYLIMKKEGIRFPIPYMEHVKKTGEELRKKLEKYGVDWWDTSEYVPLPTYFPSKLEEVPAEYDFYVTSYASIQFAFGQNQDVPWLLELGQHVLGQAEIIMNTSAAKAKGIRDGDEVWLENEVGKIKQKVRLREGIRPDTIAMLSFGQWATPVIKDKGWGSLATLTPISVDWTDPLTGAMQAQVVKAKVYKA